MTHRFLHLIHPWIIARCLRHSSFGWLAILMGIMVFCGPGGCVDCEKRFCRGLRVSSVQMMSIADRCCLEPDLPGCEDPERFFQEVLERLMLAYDACHEDNLERMRDILDELIRMFPLFSVSSLCDDHLSFDDSLRDWLEDRCGLFRNDTTCFGPQDSITVTASLSLERRPLAGSEGVFHAFQPGSEVSIDAWFLAGRSAIDGGMTLGRPRPLPGGGRIIPVIDAIFELDFRGREGVHRLSTTPSDGVEPRPAGWIVLDASGVGRLGVRLRVDGVLPDVEGPIWFESPATIVRSRLMIESPADGDALALFPVVPSVRHLFDVIDDPHGTTSSSDDYGFDPCERVGGITRRALGWLQRLRFVFPDCFATTEARGDGRAITPKTDRAQRGSPSCPVPAL